jgi:hypothetical protein
MADQLQPKSPPQRVEVRVAGRVRFAKDCYDVDLREEDNAVKLHAALEPTLVKVAPVAPPARFGPDSDDPRNRDEVIQQVHSGSRRPKKQVAAPSPKEQT